MQSDGRGGNSLGENMDTNGKINCPTCGISDPNDTSHASQRPKTIDGEWVYPSMPTETTISDTTSGNWSSASPSKEASRIDIRETLLEMAKLIKLQTDSAPSDSDEPTIVR